MLLFTLLELMLYYVLSYWVTYTVIWIQRDPSSYSGDRMISGLVEFIPFCGRQMVVLGEGSCTCLFPHLLNNPKISFADSQHIEYAYSCVSFIVLANTFSSRVPLMVFEANVQEELITQRVTGA